MTGPAEEHYLKRELYELVRSDSDVFEFLQAGSLDGIWYWDVGNPDEEWLSPRFKELFGYRDDEIPNSSAWWQANIHPDDLQLALQNFTAHCKDPANPYDQVVRYRHRDGSTVWVRCRGMAIRDGDGRAVRLLGAHTDITELMETRLRLERSNRDLQDFTRLASHDLREPLRGVVTYASILEEEYGGRLGADGQEIVGKLVEQVTRMDALIGDLLTYSRLSGEPVNRRPVEVSGVVGAVKAALGDLLEHSGVEIRIPQPLPVVVADPAKLTTIYEALVSNAVKFRDGPGWVEFGWSGGCDAPVLWVADDGIGVDDRFHERIFALFHRLHSRGAYGGGTGIGLTLARQAVQMHGGRMWVESAPGKGTRVSFTLGPDRTSSGGHTPTP